MTNADKYNISEVQADKMSDEFAEWHQNNPDVRGYGEALYRFFQAKVKPTLTEDEKVILRSIDIEHYQRIGRVKKGLYVANAVTRYYIKPFEPAFQFIQPRRRI